MGVLISKKLFIKKSMFIACCAMTVIGLSLNVVAMATNFWIVSTGCQVDPLQTSGACVPDLELTANYGLFKGFKTLDTLFGPNDYPLTVFCPAGQGVCLLSCGRNAEEQQQEFDYLRFGTGTFTCSAAKKSFVERGDKANTPALPEKFLQFAPWLATVIFLALTLAFQLTSVGLSALNCTSSVPVEVWLGPTGIYLANGAAGLTGLITLAIWGGLYSTDLSSELAIQETILETWTSETTGLGYSYWLVLASLLTTIASCVFIRFRNVPKNYLADKEGVVHTDMASSGGGAILLY